MTLKGPRDYLRAIFEFSRLKGRTRSDTFNLVECYSRAITHRLLSPHTYVCLGQFLHQPIEVDLDGIWMSVRPRSDDLNYLVPSHKPLTIRRLMVHPNDFVVDVGAHIGYFTLVSARLGARVVSVEPNRETYEVLTHNVRLNQMQPRVTTVNSALGSSTKEMQVFSRAGYTGTSSLTADWDTGNPRLKGVPYRRVNTVQVISLDQLLDQFDSRSVDWLLIDTEGYEAEVLTGATKTLRTVRNVIMEAATGESTTNCRRILEDSGLAIMETEQADPGTNYIWASCTTR